MTCATLQLLSSSVSLHFASENARKELGLTGLIPFDVNESLAHYHKAKDSYDEQIEKVKKLDNKTTRVTTALHNAKDRQDRITRMEKEKESITNECGYRSTALEKFKKSFGKEEDNVLSFDDKLDETTYKNNLLTLRIKEKAADKKKAELHKFQNQKQNQGLKRKLEDLAEKSDNLQHEQWCEAEELVCLKQSHDEAFAEWKNMVHRRKAKLQLTVPFHETTRLVLQQTKVEILKGHMGPNVEKKSLYIFSQPNMFGIIYRFLLNDMTSGNLKRLRHLFKETCVTLYYTATKLEIEENSRFWQYVDEGDIRPVCFSII